MKPGDQPVIVVRRKVHGHGHHGGAWKVAYADFVTAMMAFFLVMWLAAQDSTIRSAVAGYFQEPGLLPHEQSNGIVASGQGGIDSSGMPTLIQRRPEAMLDAEQQVLGTAVQRIQQRTSQLPGAGGQLGQQIEYVMTPDGLRIELIEHDESSFFATGSSVLQPGTVAILGVIADEVGQLDNDVVVEGHTDSRPFVDGQPHGNWVLSSDRANAALRVMLQDGLRPGQVRAVRGLADTDLRVPGDPLDPRNRRVSIIVQAARQGEIAADPVAPPIAPDLGLLPVEPGGDVPSEGN